MFKSFPFLPHAFFPSCSISPSCYHAQPRDLPYLPRSSAHQFTSWHGVVGSVSDARPPARFWYLAEHEQHREGFIIFPMLARGENVWSLFLLCREWLCGCFVLLSLFRHDPTLGILSAHSFSFIWLVFVFLVEVFACWWPRDLLSIPTGDVPMG